MNKEIEDALHTLLHCSLKDTEYETQFEQYKIVRNYITDLQQENKQLKEELENDIDRYEDTISYLLGYDSAKTLYEKILTELEEWLNTYKSVGYEDIGTFQVVLDKIQELKEKYK